MLGAKINFDWSDCLILIYLRESPQKDASKLSIS